MFEKFLHTKYIGQKRFSLEGGESTIAALDEIINTAVESDETEVGIEIFFEKGAFKMTATLNL